jgi:hypothetical protein
MKTIEEEKVAIVFAQRPEIEAELDAFQKLAIDAPPYYGVQSTTNTTHQATATATATAIIPRRDIRRRMLLPTEEVFPLVDLQFEWVYPEALWEDDDISGD